MTEFVLTVTGFDELTRKLEDPELLGKPLRSFLNDGVLTLIDNVVRLNPNDTGRSSADITQSKQIDNSPVPLWGSMGSSIIKPPYPVFMEKGTRPHWPPSNAPSLVSWARRHHISLFLVRRAIARRGTAPRRMFERGLQNSLSTIESLLSKLAYDIEAMWGGK